MRQLREFAQRAQDFEKLGVQVVGLTVDERSAVKKVWNDVAQGKFTILSDPDTKVIREYGLLHDAGRDGQDIAIRATILIDAAGRERWRRVSESVADIPTADEILDRIRQTLQGSDKQAP